MQPLVFKKNVSLLSRWIRHDFPRIVGAMGVEHFKDSFRKEGFTDKVFVHWEEVQRRKPDYQKLVLKRGRTKRSQKFTKAQRTSPILTQSGDLGDSLRWDADYNSVSFQTDVKYAQAHNEGTNNAGKGKKTKIPQRQFMGPSAVLNVELRKELEHKIKSFFKF